MKNGDGKMAEKRFFNGIGTLISEIKHPNGLQWKYPPSKLKSNLIISVLMLVLIGLTVVMLYILFSDKIEICTTATCVRTSMELLQYIDPKVNPCEDFYLFACGNFIKTTNLEEVGSRSVSISAEEDIENKLKIMLEDPISLEDSIAFNQAKTFYRACMNETEIERRGLVTVKGILREIGGWPTIEERRWEEYAISWPYAMHKLRGKGLNSSLFFSVTVDRNVNDEGKYILGLHAMTYSPSRIENETRSLYLDYMVDIARIFGADRETARKDSNDIIDLRLKLAKIYVEAVRNNQTNRFDLHNLSELQGRYPTLYWKNYLNGILTPAESVRDDEVVAVNEPIHLKAVLEILDNSPRRVLANFIAWQTLQHLINYLPARVIDRAHEYLGKINGRILREPRWKICAKVTQERMDSVISEAFTKLYFPETSKRSVEEMILNVKIQFKNNLKRIRWLDENTKELIVGRLLNSYEDVGSYNDLMEIQLRNQAYDEAQVYEDNLLESALSLDFISQNIEFSRLRLPAKENWLGKSSFVTGLYAYYSYKGNTLKFPAGIFGGVYFQEDRPKYVNYGIVGAIIAHELSHVFLDVLQSWSMDSLVSLGEELKCLSEQYEKFEIGELNRHLDSNKTVNEDMADLAGVKTAYDTYSSWVKQNGVEPRLPGLDYSPSQLFWISFAFRHCSKFTPLTLQRYFDNYQWSPPHFRVIGALQNLDDFAVDFGCPIGTKMNPEDKCYAW